MLRRLLAGSFGVVVVVLYPSVALAVPTGQQIHDAGMGAHALLANYTHADAVACDQDTPARDQRAQNGTVTEQDARCNRIVEVGAAIASLESGGACTMCDALIAWCAAAEIVEAVRAWHAEMYDDMGRMRYYDPYLDTYYRNLNIWLNLTIQQQVILEVGVIVFPRLYS